MERGIRICALLNLTFVALLSECNSQGENSQDDIYRLLNVRNGIYSLPILVLEIIPVPSKDSLHW